MNFENIAASQQRNMEAFVTVNRLAMEGFQAIAQRNAEMFRNTYENSAENFPLRACSPATGRTSSKASI